MGRVIVGTVSVTGGGTVVTAWSGATLTELNCPPGSPVTIQGMANFVKQRLSVTSFELEVAHAGAGGTLLATGISAFTPTEVSAGTLNARTAQVIQELDTLDANGRGLFFNTIGVTGDNDPGPGAMAFNEAIISDVTEIYMDVLDANDGGRDVTPIMDLWTPGTVLIVRSLATTAYAAFQLSTQAQDMTGYRKLAVSFLGSSGSLASEPVSVEWSIIGTGIQIDYVGAYADRSTYDAAAEGKIFASVDGAAGAGPPTVLYRKDSATSGDWSAAIPFQGEESDPRVAIVVWDPGRPGAGETVWSGILDVAVDFPVDFNDINHVSRAKAGVTATATAVYSIQKNGVEFGTLSFGAGITNGVFDGTATSFVAGDVLSIVAPSPRDATLAQVALTLAGNR